MRFDPRVALAGLAGLLMACASPAPGSARSGHGTATPPAADLVLRGGDIMTMNPAMPRAQALAVRGGRIVAGSDVPVEEVQPLLGVYAAVTRQDPSGQPPGGWYPEQRMSLDEAIEAFTVAPAYAAFVDTQRGRLAPGYVADITVYDRSLAADATLLQTRIDLTLVGGRIAFERM